MVRCGYWIIVLFASCLCVFLAVAQSTQQQDLSRKVPGRQTYFDIQQITELWKKFVFTHQADVVSHTQMNDSSNMLQENTQNFQLDPIPLQKMASSGESFSASAQNTSRCLNDLQRILLESDGGKTWALSFLDSAGKPGPSLLQERFYFVGNYKQCRATVAPDDSSSNSTGFGANYVVVDLILVKSSLQGTLITAGLCLPATCSEAEIEQILKEGVASSPLNGTVTVISVQIRDSEREITTATVLSIVVICVIGTLMILGTAFDIIFLQWPKWQLEKQSENDETSIISGKGQDSNGYQSIRDETGNGNVEGAPLLGKPIQSTTRTTGKMSQVLVSFSVYTNGSKVLNTSQPPGSLTCINGIRFLSMTWVILGHSIIGTAWFWENQMNLIDKFKRWTSDALTNATVSVDTFFALSGLLTAYVILKEMKKRTCWRINWGLVYFHRFWRLTPPYMLSLLLVLGLQRFLGEGELWDKIQPDDKEFCENNWWTNLLYINNLVNADKICFAHSWFLANNMQFFIVSPLMLIPFYFNHYAGLSSCLAFLLTSMITTGVLTADRDWLAVVLSRDETYVDYYIKPWCRIGPYVIGILTGYLLVISNNKVSMKWYTVVIGWAVAVATALAVLYGLHDYIIGEEMLSTSVRAFYNAVARTAWSISVCWVIVACVSGYGGFVNTLLSWSPFVVLGRLTYMAYLVDLPLITVYMGNRGQLLHVGELNIIVYFLGIVFLSYMTAFVLMLGLESPMIGLEKTFLPHRNTTREWSTSEKEEEKKPSTDGSSSHNPSEGNRNIDGETRDGE